MNDPSQNTASPQTPPKRGGGKNYIDFYELESRVLYSATPLDVETLSPELTGDTGEPLAVEDLQQLAPEESLFASLSAAQDSIDLLLSVDGFDEAAKTESGEIVFVFSDVSEAEQLTAGIDPSAEVILVDASENGVEFISGILSQRQGLNAIHIVSHGQDGQAQLGLDRLDASFLADNEALFQDWRTSLANDADLLFYGCNLAESDTGQELMSLLAATCDCDVAASTDLTGHQSQTGNWDLEYQVGKIQTDVFISESAQLNWNHTLATFTVVDSGDSGVGTLRWAIDQANSTSGVDTIDFAIPVVGGFETIQILSTLEITEEVILDASTQTGFTGSPLIELDGTNLSGADPILRLAAGSDGTLVSGFAFVNGAGGSALEIQSDGNLVTANYFGVSANGTTVKSNNSGITVSGNNNQIGNGSSSEANLISGNHGFGLRLTGTATGNDVFGNSIGVDINGDPLGNGGSGILIDSDATGNTIGDVIAGRENLIAFNGDDGVSLTGNSTNNSVRGNLIFSNGNAGDDLQIDLGDDGITANDISLFSNDDDTGPNDLQNFPEIESAILDGNQLRIIGSATGSNSSDYDYDFYFGSTLDSNGSTGAEAYVGSASGTTNLAGFDDFDVTFTNPNIVLGGYITVTATRSDGNTSEFSQALRIANADSALLFTTFDSVANSPNAGSVDWTTEDILMFGGPSTSVGSYTLGSGTTDGTISRFIDFDNFTLGTANITAVHYVRSTLTIGSGGDSVELRAGDVIFANAESSRDFFGKNGTTSSDSGDVLMFRPEFAGDYSSGSFRILLDNPSNQDILALSLVESNGGVDLADGTNLAQGTFLLSIDKSGGRDIHTFFATSAGESTTSGTETKLIDGSDAGAGIDEAIQSITIVEADTTLGGISLNQGDILYSLIAADNDIGLNGGALTEFDIGVLEVVSVDQGGNTSEVNSRILFQGSDVGLTNASDAITSFSLTSLAPTPEAPTNIGLSNSTVSENQDSTTGISIGQLTTTDTDSSSFTYTIVAAVGDSDKFSIGGVGNDELILTDTSLPSGVLDFETTSSYSVRVRSTDSDNLSTIRDLTITVTNVNDAPTTTGLPDETVQEDAAPFVYALASLFDDPEQAASTLTYTVVGNTDPSLFSSISVNTDNNLEIALANDQNGSSDITIRATDAGGLFVENTFRLTVTPENDAPTTAGLPDETVQEDAAPFVYALASLFDDPEQAASTLTYTVVGNTDPSLFSSISVNTDNNLEIALANNQNGASDITIRATDAGGLFVEDTFRLTVSPENDAPTTTGLPDETVQEDAAPFVYALASLFDDPEQAASTLTYTVVGNTDPSLFSSISVDTDNNLEIALANNQNGASDITIRATDAGGLFVEDTFRLTVSPENDAPTVASPIGDFTAQAKTTRTIDLSSVFADVDIATNGDFLTFSLATTNSTVATGSISGSNLELTFDSPGTVNFTITATDQQGSSVVNSFQVEVFDGDPAPIIDPISLAVDENSSAGTLVGTVTADPQGAGDSVKFEIIGGSGQNIFQIDSNTGEVTVRDPNALDFETITQFEIQVQATDTGSKVDTELITVSINDVNETPILSTNLLRIQENQTLVGVVSASDEDGDALSYRIVGGVDASFFTINSTTGELSFITPPDFETPSDNNANKRYLVEIEVSDGAHSSTSVIRVGVEDVNEAPTTTGLSNVVLMEDSGAILIDLSTRFSDFDAGDSLSFSVIAANGRNDFYSLRLSGTTLQILPLANQNGTGSITIQAMDSGGLTEAASFTVDVTPVNDAPVGRSDEFLIQDTVLRGENLLSNDVDADGNSLTAVLVSDARNGTVKINPDGTFVYQANEGFSGRDVFTYRISDGSLSSDPISVVVDVIPAVNAPVATPDTTDSSEPEIENTETETQSDATNSDTGPVGQPVASIEQSKSGSDTLEGKQTALKPLEQANRSESLLERELNETNGQFTILYRPSAAERIEKFTDGEWSNLDILDQPTSAEAIVGNRWMWQALDEYQNQVEAESNIPVAILGSTAGFASSISVGYLIWLIRGGNILAAVMANLPAWSLIDPLPVLSRLESDQAAGDDSLESIIENTEAKLDAPADSAAKQ